MAWIDAAVVAMTLVVLAWGPGLATLWAWTNPFGRVGAVAVAPALTMLIVAPTAVVAAVIGVRWSVGALVVGTATACAPGVALTWRRRTRMPARVLLTITRRQSALVASVAVGLACQVIPILIAMGDPRHPQSGQDTVFHVDVLRWIRQSGDASSLDVSTVATVGMTTPSGYYPAAWHGLTSLLPYLPNVTTAFNVSEILLATLPWVVGALFLARTAFPSRPRVWVTAPVIAGLASSLPITLALQSGGLTPNAVGGALVPGAVAAGVLAAQQASWRIVVPAVAVLAGTALAHPSAATAAVVLVAPAFYAGVLRRFARPATHVVLVAALGAVLVGAAATPRLHRMVTARADQPGTTWLSAVRDALLARADGAWITGASLTVVAGLIGGVLAWRAASARPVLIGALLLLAIEVVVGARVPISSIVGSPWYAETRRLASPVTAAMIPLAAFAVDRALTILGAPHTRAGGLARVAVAGVCGALLVVVVPAGVLDLSSAARSALRPSDAGLVAPGEAGLLERIPREIDGGTVLASPYSGANYLYAISRVPVVPLSAAYTPTTDSRLVVTHLDELRTDPAVCAAAHRLSLGYVYVDSRQAWSAPDFSGALRAPAGSRLIDRGGNAALYQLPECAA